jgi:hypothetical protein
VEVGVLGVEERREEAETRGGGRSKTGGKAGNDGGGSRLSRLSGAGAFDIDLALADEMRGEETLRGMLDLAATKEEGGVPLVPTSIVWPLVGTIATVDDCDLICRGEDPSWPD